MRKVSRSRADDDVVSSTNGSGSVANEERQEAEKPDRNDEDTGDKGTNDVDDDSDDYLESPKKSKTKTTKKRKSDRSSNKKEEEEEEAEYEVEKIIDSKKIKGKLHYLIRWKGYSAGNDTWEPHNTLSCPELISKFNEEKENSKNNSPKKAAKRKGTKKASKSSPKKTKTEWHDKDTDENAEYEVERILEVHHKKNGERSFLIHWKGWSNKFDSWEPESNLNCPELIKRFMEKVDVARSTDSRSLRVAPETTHRFTLQDPSSGRRLSKRRGQRQRVRYDNAE
ncbi:chromobox protein homolog 1-like [Pararge aegeria]|uniref:Jg25361 protein n=2 Tax=Pararge aegeria TaxID=116150 RepID=A0A8S4S1M8_9NEOP|nr:chromobox protein homolog 1-like [Pararge aegeria]CAH2244415.1 jg25361 [Pararge aegeria aegeria]